MKLKDILERQYGYDLGWEDDPGAEKVTGKPKKKKPESKREIVSDIIKQNKVRENLSLSGGTRLGYSPGAGLGGTGASVPPKPNPSDIEFDMDQYQKELKGKDTTADHRTSKVKRTTLQKYLKKRSMNKL